MFAYLRIFSIISFLVVIGITIFAGSMLRGFATEDVVYFINRNVVNISEGYAKSIWHHHKDSVAALEKKEISPDDKEVLEFAAHTLDYFKTMPILRFNLYGKNGALIMSYDVAKNMLIDNGGKSPDKLFVTNNLSGFSPSKQVLSDVAFKNGDKGDIVQTLFPMVELGKNSPPTLYGVLEIISDLREPIEKIDSLRMSISIGVVAMFFLLFGVLFALSRIAEGIIAKQHETNVELASSAAAAQAESQEKSQFLANVSHELRTPLNSIIGFSEIIKNTGLTEDNAEKFGEYINDIHASGSHLLSLINDILDYSKAEAGKLELEMSEVNANKLVHNCVRLVVQRAEKAQVQLVESLPKDYLNLTTDSKKFKQILLNLLSNAIKFTNPGGEVRISAWADINDDSFVFEIKDSGIGIAAKDISRAMSPFGQVDNALSRKYDGTGLGLPLTKKFVEIMGGKFGITSEVGVGTTITFSLPRTVRVPEGIIVKYAE